MKNRGYSNHSICCISMKKEQLKSYLFVSVQFLCLIGFFYFGLEKTFTVATQIFLFVGCALLLWARQEMGKNNFRVQPIPKDSLQLVTSGPFKLIRHPIYTALLLGMLAIAINTNTWVAYMLWIFFFADLYFKLRFEEDLLLEKFPEYREYMNRTKRLLPWVW